MQLVIFYLRRQSELPPKTKKKTKPKNEIIYFIYRVVFVSTLHVIAYKLDVSYGLLKFKWVALSTSQLTHVAQVGRNGRRRRRWWRRRRRRWKIVKVDYLAEQLRSVVDPSRPSPTIFAIQTPIGDVLQRNAKSSN
jgi:hypothetical protein